MSGLSQEEKDDATVFLPAGHDYNEFKSDDEIEWDKFTDEMGEGIDYAKITVYKVPTNERGGATQKQMSFCFECGMQDYSFSQICSKIQSEFGGGIYRIQARNEKGQMMKNKGISIEAPKTSGANDGSNPADIIDRVTNAINQGQEQTRRMLTGTHNPMANIDPLDQMTKLMAAMGSMMAAMGITPQQPAPVQSVGAQIKEFLLIRDLMGNLGGDSGGGSEANLYSLLTETMKSFGGPIAAAIAAGQQTGEVSPTGLLAAPNPVPELTAEQKAEIEKGEAMKTQINILISNAKAKSDPKQFANLVVTNTPEEKLDDLYNFISAEDFMQRIIAINPAAEVYSEWFMELRKNVLELLTEPDDENTIPESETVAGNPELELPISDESSSDTGENS